MYNRSERTYFWFLVKVHIFGFECFLKVFKIFLLLYMDSYPVGLTGRFQEGRSDRGMARVFPFTN
uniref:Uncharacterized protein n=1 Tax=Anguilla anguilla TaxID=7936 RepID=A0A0E9SPH4_ANGAN